MITLNVTEKPSAEEIEEWMDAQPSDGHYNWRQCQLLEQNIRTYFRATNQGQAPMMPASSAGSFADMILNGDDTSIVAYVKGLPKA